MVAAEAKSTARHSAASRTDSSHRPSLSKPPPSDGRPPPPSQRAVSSSRAASSSGTGYGAGSTTSASKVHSSSSAAARRRATAAAAADSMPPPLLSASPALHGIAQPMLVGTPEAELSFSRMEPLPRSVSTLSEVGGPDAGAHRRSSGRQKRSTTRASEGASQDFDQDSYVSSVANRHVHAWPITLST